MRFLDATIGMYYAFIVDHYFVLATAPGDNDDICEALSDICQSVCDCIQWQALSSHIKTRLFLVNSSIGTIVLRSPINM